VGDNTIGKLRAVPLGYEQKSDTSIVGRAAAGVFTKEDGTNLRFARFTGIDGPGAGDPLDDRYETLLDAGVQIGKVRHGDKGVQIAADVTLLKAENHGLTIAGARAHFKSEVGERHVQYGAGVRVAELGAENAEGDVFKGIVGWDAGFGMQWGSDPDGDGRPNYGLRIAFAAFWGLEVGFSVE
jgi:hypothetical protein